MSRLVDVRNVGQEKLLFILHVTFFSSSAGARGERAAWIYRQATRLRCNCDNGGRRIDVNSGLMADFIDFTIDDQNAVLAGVSIGLE